MTFPTVLVVYPVTAGYFTVDNCSENVQDIYYIQMQITINPGVYLRYHI